MVYVLDQNGQPLMPTSRHGKVRRMLQSGRAKVVNRCPFTIQLNYESGHQTQEISLGIDAGSQHIGVSATTKVKVLYEAEVELRNDIVDLLSSRRELRRGRRTRKTRYRQPRFQNRKKKDGWLAPSIRQKVGTHMAVVEKVCKILPVKLSWKPHRLIFKRSKIRRFMVWNTNREISLVFGMYGSMSYVEIIIHASAAMENQKIRY